MLPSHFSFSICALIYNSEAICDLIIIFSSNGITVLLELLVIVRVPFLIIARPQVSVPLNTLPVAHYRKGGTTAHLTLYPGRSLKKNGLATYLSSNC